MLDIRFIRENPEAVKENIKKKFQEAKLPLVDQVIALDQENRDTIQEAQALRTARNAKSKQVGMLMGQRPEACGMAGVCGRQYVVEADGGVYPCDFYMLDAYRLGSFVTDSFEQIEARREEIGFLDIPRRVGEALERVKPVERPSLEDILLADHAAREAVRCAR